VGVAKLLGLRRWASRALRGTQLAGERTLDIWEVDIADRDDVLAEQPLHVLHAHAADADARDVQRRARGLIAASAEHVTGNDHGAQRGTRGVADELTPRIVLRHGEGPC